MKNLKSLFWIFILLSFTHLKAQSNLFGKWKVSCAIERTSGSSIKSCGICPNKLVEGMAMINDFEMEISKDFIKINTETKGTEIPYKWKAETDAIEFNYNKTNYIFKVLMLNDPDQQVFKDAIGNILVLKRIP